MSKGYESLKAAVIRDCTNRNACGCFNPEGCDKKVATSENTGSLDIRDASISIAISSSGSLIGRSTTAKI